MNILPRRNLGPGENWGRFTEGRVQELLDKEEIETLFQLGAHRNGLSQVSTLGDQITTLENVRSGLQFSEEELDLLLSVNVPYLIDYSQSAESFFTRQQVFFSRATSLSLTTSWATKASVSVPEYQLNLPHQVFVGGNAVFHTPSDVSDPSLATRVEARILVGGVASPVWPCTSTFGNKYKMIETSWTRNQKDATLVELQFRASLDISAATVNSCNLYVVV